MIPKLPLPPPPPCPVLIVTLTTMMMGSFLCVFMDSPLPERLLFFALYLAHLHHNELAEMGIAVPFRRARGVPPQSIPPEWEVGSGLECDSNLMKNYGLLGDSGWFGKMIVVFAEAGISNSSPWIEMTERSSRIQYC